MIQLMSNSDNIIAVTASEKATETDFYYLFRFFLIEQNKNFAIQLTKTNTSSERFDRFELNLPTDIDLPSGKYHYYIYQSLEDGNLDWDGLVELENGKATVPVNEIENKEFETNGGQDYTFEIS